MGSWGQIPSRSLESDPKPFRVSGVVRGRVMTLSVAVDDTVERKLEILGPATLTLGRDASMGPCPICDARMF